MDDFIVRQPILNSKVQVIAYHLIFGRSVRNMLSGEANEQESNLPEGAQAVDALVSDLSNRSPTYIDYFEGLTDVIVPVLPDKSKQTVVVIFGKNDEASPDVCAALKAKGFRVGLDSAYFSANTPAASLADVMLVEFTTVNLSTQAALIKKYKGSVMLLAAKIETWSDFKVAKDMGYELFKGFFFLWPTGSVVQREIKSLDICLVSILSELEKPEPNFKSISEMIEHDLGLSYKLLRLVNSAYMAPKYKIKSITQALTYLGTRELHQWISMLMFNGIKSDENSELVVMSLIRGKLMALVAQELQLEKSGAEPFFAGLFSLIDVILNRDINAILTGLPLADDIKAALLGGGNILSELLSFTVSYEQAEWRKLEGRFPMNAITPQRMITLYIEALKWSKLADHSA